MTLQQLASKISKIEGKKSQAKIGDIREILKIIVQIDATQGDAILCLIKASTKEINKKVKK